MEGIKYFDWSEEKNVWLKADRGIGFEEIIVSIAHGMVHDILLNPNQKTYPNQKIYVVEVNSYIYMVPFVEDETKIFLKTIFPSRKATKKYIIKQIIL